MDPGDRFAAVSEVKRPLRSRFGIETVEIYYGRMYHNSHYPTDTSARSGVTVM
jgi:hypothetical protein